MKEIDITKIIKLLLSHIFPILLAGVILAGAVFCYNTFWSKPVYRTSTSVLINNGGLADDSQSPNGTISQGIMSASLSLVPTCIDMMESDNIYNPALRNNAIILTCMDVRTLGSGLLDTHSKHNFQHNHNNN